METYNDLLLRIEEIKNDPVTPKRSLMLSILKQMVQTIALSIRAHKLQLKQEITIDGFDHFSLVPFFGNNDMKEHEKKLKDLRKKLREISEKDKEVKF